MRHETKQEKVAEAAAASSATRSPESDGTPDRQHPSALPPKLYFRIGEVAQVVGVEPHVLRYWEREFRAIRPTKSAKGQRVYSRRDVENLLRVRDLLYGQRFTIAGARKKLAEGADPSLDEGIRTAEAASSVQTVEEAFDDPMAATRASLAAMRDEICAFLAELDASFGDGGYDRAKK